MNVRLPRDLSLLVCESNKRAGWFLASICLGVGTGAQAQTVKEPRERNIEEVIVTAQKRDERIQDVPISISVLGGAELDRATDRGVSEALNSAPGVVSIPSNYGQRVGGNSFIAIRGVAPSAVGAGVVASYLDSIPFGFAKYSFAPDSNPYDLDHIEVLRGPQGTLYGASALNGVVRVLTRDANLEEAEFKARTSVSAVRHGAESYRGDMAVNVPLIAGRVAARAVVGYQSESGWIDRANKEDANDQEISNVRLKINAQPTDNLSIGLFGWMSRTDTGAPALTFDGRNNLNLLAEPASNDFDAYGLRLRYDLATVTISSATSYIDFNNSSVVDFAPFGVPNTPITTLFSSKVFAEELAINSTAGEHWKWTIGGMYRDASDRDWQDAPNLYAAPDAKGTTSESFAVFGELTRLFANGRWELTGGLRYFEDKVSDRERSRFDVVGGVPEQGLAAADRTFDNLSPRFVLTWHPIDDGTVYASYSEGFRSGLNQAPVVTQAAPEFPPARPDELHNYEVGAKGSLWGGRVSLEAAAFYMDWQDVQQQLLVEITPTFLEAAFVNSESASGAGFELGATIEPIDSLSLTAAISWNDLQMDGNVQNANGVNIIPKGSRLLGSPETTLSGSANYSFALGGSGWSGLLSASAHRISETIAERSTDTGAAFMRDAILMVSASFAVESRQGWTAAIFVNNLTNEEGITTDQFTPEWNQYVIPRTIGLQFEYRH